MNFKLGLTVSVLTHVPQRIGERAFTTVKLSTPDSMLVSTGDYFFTDDSDDVIKLRLGSMLFNMIREREGIKGVNDDL